MIIWGQIPIRVFGRPWAPVMAALALLFLSCSTEPEDDSGTVLGTRTFWAQNISTEKYYQTTADLLVEGRYCKIWVEQDSKGSVSLTDAQTMADAYDNVIYPRMIAVFGVGPISDESGAFIANNTMELADWLTDGDGKLSILLLDIRDGSTQETGYVGGYFWSGNFYEPMASVEWSRYSNMIDMIYVDTNPGKPGDLESNKTLAHEMQHLMNFVTSSLTRLDASTKTFYLMDVWIDEGLSSAAEYIYLNNHVSERYNWFNEDPKGTIARGNNFFVWGNYQDASILDDYATVYLFFQWLRLQSGGTGIYRTIISSKDYNYLAVTKAANSALSGMGYDDWGTLLKTWLAANYINALDGPYGYRNDPALKTVQAKTAPAGTTSLELLPGEGAYSKTDAEGDTSSYLSGSHIKYAGLNGATGTVSDTETFSGGLLLTYNSNTDLKGQRETGRLTGVAADVRTARPGGGAQARSVDTRAWEGPVKIDARDMRARNGRLGEGDFGQVLPLGPRVFAGEAHGE